ncbi:BofC C-terminal domain-containing protein [Anaerotignum sp. MB30-C6]|uniref:BofC C-terminal domain-containing protein n=1 Tax=Anaerotignum sp. MB30-C6 TaxID=3070814 RepID=UPI0027DB49D3|nr:BofC C-terminal domain-containing protein [Anaerotignum sp. MB30-C6]WMI82241.1 BofC C-terminal domain-containing protein [Anaerotignum sp. MB30-C6]
MKKKVVLLALAGFFLSLGVGYFFSMKDEQRHTPPTQEESVQVGKREVNIKKEGKIIYQYYYTKDAITKEVEEPVPDFLEGLTRDQMQSVYNGWQIVYFSPEKVILRCSVEGASSEVYLLKEHEGYLAVFVEDIDKKMRLKELTDVPITVLPEAERQQLAEGIRVLGDENLVRLLSDFTS